MRAMQPTSPFLVFGCVITVFGLLCLSSAFAVETEVEKAEREIRAVREVVRENVAILITKSNRAYNTYLTIAEKMTLAYRFYGRVTAGRVPLYDLAYFGAHNDLRGYAAGEFVDKMMFATQLEFRWRFWKCWGMVAFGGVGKVGQDLHDLDLRELLPSAGVGLRFMASEKERVNLSIDYARGREGDAVYFYIREAF